MNHLDVFASPLRIIHPLVFPIPLIRDLSHFFLLGLACSHSPFTLVTSPHPTRSSNCVQYALQAWIHRFTLRPVGQSNYMRSSRADSFDFGA